MKIRVVIVTLALAALASAGALRGQGADELQAIAERSLGYPQHVIWYEVRAVSPARTYCLVLSLTRTGTRTRSSAERDEARCESYYGLPPRDEFPEVGWVNRAFAIAAAASSPAARVTEVEAEVIAERDARCFHVIDGSVDATVCLEEESGMILRLEAAREFTELDLRAVRVSVTPE
jgi:hypothetical protein